MTAIGHDGHRPSCTLKIFIFDHVTIVRLKIYCVPNFIKIGWFLTEIWNYIVTYIRRSQIVNVRNIGNWRRAMHMMENLFPVCQKMYKHNHILHVHNITFYTCPQNLKIWWKMSFSWCGYGVQHQKSGPSTAAHAQWWRLKNTNLVLQIW